MMAASEPLACTRGAVPQGRLEVEEWLTRLLGSIGLLLGARDAESSKRR